MTTKTTQYADNLTTENRGVVRLTELRSTDRLKIRVGNRSQWVTVRDIPINVAHLECGHVLRGIALHQNGVTFCEECHNERFITEVE